MDFPIFKTKREDIQKRFDFFNPQEEMEYFLKKAGPEIEKIKNFLENNTFIAYLIGKKNSGKGTYAKYFIQLFSAEKVLHCSVGDIVRKAEKELKEANQSEELLGFLSRYYRGFTSLEKNLEELQNRQAQKLLSTEFVLTLIKREISKHPKKTIFIDGFPRNLDQVSFSLFFRDLIGFRDDPDVFILVDVPLAVLKERVKWRRVCPRCQMPRNLKLLLTREVGFDEKEKEFYLICDRCGKRMVEKEFDQIGLEALEERFKEEEKMMEKILTLQGVPKIFLRNSIPLQKASAYVDDYEITPEYYFEYLPKERKVIKKEKKWIFKDDQNQEAVSILPQAVMLSFLHQLVKIFKL